MNRETVDLDSDKDIARLLAEIVNTFRETRWPPVARQMRELGESEPAIDAVYLDTLELITSTFMQKIVELRRQRQQ